MRKRKRINVPLNRVEGDLEVLVEITDGVVTDAWSCGSMYRGFERILVGRGALDSLVITPRICGICSTSHLTAASLALDTISGVEPPPNAVRARNLALMTEMVQNDMRHTFLMFAPDFTNPFYVGSPFYKDAVSRYASFKGETAIEVIRETKKLLEIIAIIGGQWPHSAYMVPGGITAVPGTTDWLECRHLLQHFKKWYENRVLGCSLERWREVKSSHDLFVWLDEHASHRESELGFYVRFALEAGLDTVGRGHGKFISFGSLNLPKDSAIRSRKEDSSCLIPPGFSSGSQVQTFAPEKIAEHVAHSWFAGYKGGRHPFDGETVPYASGKEGRKYSWVKAPRYDGVPAETGPLAEMIMAGNPLFLDLVEGKGPSVFVRQLARIVRPAEIIPAMLQWISEMFEGGPFFTPTGPIMEGEGCGLTHGPRGALGHWVKVRGGEITHYQIITPTVWNASPRDTDGVRGPWEEALIGSEIRDASNPIVLGHIVRSFDPCLVCAVHVIRPG